MLSAIRQRVHGPAGRLALLALALLLWPGTSFAVMDCCPLDATGPVEASGHHVAHDAAAAVSTHRQEDVVDVGELANPPCHGEAGSNPAIGAPAAHGHCDADCAARCATPNLFTAPAAWPVVIEHAPAVVRWSTRVAPTPEAGQLLRPPIAA